MTLVHRMVQGLQQRESPSLAGGNGFGGRVDLFSLLGLRSHTGITVTPERALTLTALFACCRLISSTGGGLPLNVYDLGEGRVKTPVWDDSERAIWDKPNPEVSREIFWETAFFHAALTGDSFMYAVPTAASRNRPPGQREVAQLWPLEPKRITGIVRLEGKKTYIIDGSIPATDWVTGGQIVHVPALGMDGMRGLSPVRVASESIALGLAAQEYAARRFGKGSDPGGYLSTEQEITAAQAEELSEMWKESHQGLENAHELAVLGKGTKWNTTSMNPEDAQLLQTREWQALEIAQLYGVPPHMIGLVSKTTTWGTGIEEQSRGFVTYTLQSWLTRFQSTISDELLRPKNRVCEFDSGALIRGKLVDQVNAVGALIRAGFAPAPSLSAVGLPPIDHLGLPPVTVQSADAAGTTTDVVEAGEAAQLIPA